MSRQHKRTWQRHEQAVAAAFGTRRAGAGTQNRSDGGADVRTEWLVAECKSWRTLPARVVDALWQAERAARDGQLAIAVIHQVGARRAEDLVIMRWRDFVAWFGEGEQDAGEGDDVADTPGA